MKTHLATALAAGALTGMLALATPATAAIVLTGGTGLTVAAGLGVAKNQGFNPIYGTPVGNTVSGYVFGNNNGYTFGSLGIVGGTHQIDFYFLGEESGYKNKFETKDALAATGSYQETGTSGVNFALPSSSFFSGTYGNGQIDFKFTADALTSPNKGEAPNGGTQNQFCKDCSIFVVFLTKDSTGKYVPTSPAATSGFVVDLWFDDGKGDDNHDDMAIRMVATVVPVPAALPIMAAALAGFGFAGWRRHRHAA